MSKRLVATSFVAGFLVGALQSSSAQDMSASYDKSSATQFDVKVVAPRERARAFAFCKAVWFAESRKAPSIALSQPRFGDLSEAPRDWALANREAVQEKDDWTVMTTTAYLPEDPGYQGNYKVIVAESAPNCRQTWDWYK